MIEAYAGPAHCGWESATFLNQGWPVGTSFEVDGHESAAMRVYVRDPSRVLGSRLQGRLVLQAMLPHDARATGYRDGPFELYLSPSDEDSTIYLVGPTGVEAWPRDEPLTFCE